MRIDYGTPSEKQIPEDWTLTSIEDVAELQGGYAFRSSNFVPFGFPIIRMSNLKEGDLELESAARIPTEVARNATDYELVEGDLLVGMSGSLDNYAIVRDSDLPAYLNQRVGRFVLTDPGRCLYSYLIRVVLSHFYKRQVDIAAAGAAQRNISRSDIHSIKFPLPPLDEQRRIAGILDTVDKAIRQTDELIAKLQQVKAGLLHDLLTRGLDERGRLRDPEAHPEQFVETELGRLPAEWEILPLSEIGDVDRGKFAHRPRNDPRFYGGPYPFVQTGDIAEANGGILHKYSQTLNERGTEVSRKFPAGTVAITIAANIADTAILGRPMYFPDSIVGAVVKSPHHERYVELYIRKAKRGLDAQAPQSAQKNINLQVLRPLLIPVPPSDEQNRIAEIYEAHDTRIRAEEAYRDKLTKLKQGLMQDLLTGRVRVGADSELGDGTN